MTEHSTHPLTSSSGRVSGEGVLRDDPLTPNDRLYAELYAAFWEIDVEPVLGLLRSLRLSGLRVRCIDGLYFAWTYPGMSPI